MDNGVVQKPAESMQELHDMWIDYYSKSIQTILEFAVDYNYSREDLIYLINTLQDSFMSELNVRKFIEITKTKSDGHSNSSK